VLRIRSGFGTLLKTEVLGNKLQAKRNTDPDLDQEKGLDPAGPESGSGINTAFQNHQITVESWNVLLLRLKTHGKRLN
jgi:hypothetical protein